MHTHYIEKKICKRLINTIHKQGYKFDINDGEEDVIRHSRDKKAAFEALFSTDEDYIIVRNDEGQRLGSIWLIHGNGIDVISDYSTSLEPILEPVTKWIEQEFYT